MSEFVENPYLLLALAGLNAHAVALDIEAMAETKTLRPGSNALQSAALTCAMSMDLGAGPATAQLSKELRATMAELRCDVTSDDLATFMGTLGIAVGDTAVSAADGDSPEPVPSKPRSRRRDGDGEVEVAADAVAAPRTGRSARS